MKRLEKNKTESKKLVGVKMTERTKAVIKSRATLENSDMQSIYDEMVDDYLIKKPATVEELAMSKTMLANSNKN